MHWIPSVKSDWEKHYTYCEVRYHQVLSLIGRMIDQFSHSLSLLYNSIFLSCTKACCCLELCNILIPWLLLIKSEVYLGSNHTYVLNSIERYLNSYPTQNYLHMDNNTLCSKKYAYISCWLYQLETESLSSLRICFFKPSEIRSRYLHTSLPQWLLLLSSRKGLSHIPALLLLQ